MPVPVRKTAPPGPAGTRPRRAALGRGAVHLTAALFVAALALWTGPARGTLAADWPGWRGPERTGVTPEASGYPAGWPPRRLWSRNVGVGCTSPILAEGRLYVLGWHGPGNVRANPVGRDTLWCFDARTGTLRWRRSYPCRYHSRQRAGDLGQYGGPSSTPTFDPETGYLYTLSTDGDLACWDARHEGRPVWRLNLYETFPIPKKPDVGQGRREYGYPQTPVLWGRAVLVEVGSSKGTVVAFEKRSGRVLWRSEATDLAGHSSGPTLMTVEGVPCLADFALRRVLVMRLDPGHEGRTVGAVGWTTDFANNIATPAAWKNLLVVTSDYNVSRTACFEVTLRGLRERWRVREHAKVGSPVIYKGRVFLVNGPVMCLDLATGRRLWQGGDFYHGSCLVTAGDDRLIVFGRGRVVLVDALAEGYRERAKVEGLFRATCYPHPALAEGVLAVKDKKGNLVVLDVGGPRAAGGR